MKRIMFPFLFALPFLLMACSKKKEVDQGELAGRAANSPWSTSFFLLQAINKNGKAKRRGNIILFIGIPPTTTSDE